MKEVSVNCLHKQAVPAVLRKIWEEYNEEDWTSGLLGSFAFLPLGSMKETDLELFRSKNSKDWGKLLDQMAVFAMHEDGHYACYWLHEKGMKLEEAPIILLDTDATFHVRAESIQDFMIYEAADFSEEALNDVSSWLKKNKFGPVKTVKQIEEYRNTFLDKFPKLKKYKDEYLLVLY